MELPGRRSSYSLLSQYPDDPPPPPAKFDSPPASQTLTRPFPQIQRQSSGSSFAESSISGGDYYMPTTISSVTPTIDIAAAAAAGGGDRRGSGAASSGSAKSWAQQAEETYQMQLALALRLCSDAACANDPNFLEAGEQITGGGAMAAVTASAGAEAMSYRFWVRILNFNVLIILEC